MRVSYKKRQADEGFIASMMRQPCRSSLLELQFAVDILGLVVGIGFAIEVEELGIQIGNPEKNYEEEGKALEHSLEMSHPLVSPSDMFPMGWMGRENHHLFT